MTVARSIIAKVCEVHKATDQLRVVLGQIDAFLLGLLSHRKLDAFPKEFAPRTDNYSVRIEGGRATCYGQIGKIAVLPGPKAAQQKQSTGSGADNHLTMAGGQAPGILMVTLVVCC